MVRSHRACVCVSVCTQVSTQAQKTIQRTGRPQSLPPYEYVSFQKPRSVSALSNSAALIPSPPPMPLFFSSPHAPHHAYINFKIGLGSTAHLHLRIYLGIYFFSFFPPVLLLKSLFRHHLFFFIDESFFFSLMAF